MLKIERTKKAKVVSYLEKKKVHQRGCKLNKKIDMKKMCVLEVIKYVSTYKPQ